VQHTIASIQPAELLHNHLRPWEFTGRNEVTPTLMDYQTEKWKILYKSIITFHVKKGEINGKKIWSPALQML
jgi:hypothetical protein